MSVYGSYLYFLLRLSGQLTPAELQVLGLPSSTWIFLVHNLLLLLILGSGTTYNLKLGLDKSIQAEQPIAMFVITGLFLLSATATYFFLAVRHVVLHKSYRALQKFLRSTPDFLRPPLSDRPFKICISLFFTAIVGWRTTNAITILYRYPNKPLWSVLAAASTMATHAYSILYAMKLVLISRHVKIHFLRANRLLNGCITTNSRHSKFCTLPQAEFERVVRFQWDCYDFLDKVNRITGPDWFMLLFYFYLAILYRLYNLSAYSALFTAEDTQTSKMLFSLGQSVMNVTLVLIMLGNGSEVTHEIRKNSELIRNAVPRIRCTDCKKRFDEFANRVSHLSPDLTANGIFTLNRKTFSNMISSAATQLVILISLGNQS